MFPKSKPPRKGDKEITMDPAEQRRLDLARYRNYSLWKWISIQRVTNTPNTLEMFALAIEQRDAIRVLRVPPKTGEPEYAEIAIFDGFELVEAARTRQVDRNVRTISIEVLKFEGWDRYAAPPKIGLFGQPNPSVPLASCSLELAHVIQRHARLEHLPMLVA